MNSMKESRLVAWSAGLVRHGSHVRRYYCGKPRVLHGALRHCPVDPDWVGVVVVVYVVESVV